MNLLIAQNLMKRLMAKAKSDKNRLAAADELVTNGDVDTACLIYQRLALSRPRREASETAKQRIKELQDEARQELAKTESLQGMKLLQRYKDLENRFGGVPVVGNQIGRQLRRTRAAMSDQLNEQEARRLWALGKEHERDQRMCCAYIVYQQSIELMTDEQAARAKRWIARLERDPGLEASVAACQTLQQSHEKFELAEMYAKADPKKASQHYEWVVEHAPKDSSVYDAAIARLAANR